MKKRGLGEFQINRLLCGFALYSALIVITLFYPTQIKAQQSDTLKAKDLVNLSFAELMNVQIKTGTLISMERSKVPSTLTIITREEIENTPARNLLDLLEVYVPGGTFTNHWLGSRIGIRGIMSDQNNSFLLIVDGENMNLHQNNGPLFEIQNRDLSDIEKIEIICGPGSVTYGPGVIGGVISITTKDANTADKLNVGVDHNPTYRYSSINSSFTIKKKKLSAYMFGSIGRSNGIENPEFYYIDRAHGYGYGFMSDTWGNKDLGTAAPNFYADFKDKPEIKFQLNIDFLNRFKFKARYTNYSFIKQQQKTESQEGEAFPGSYGQQFTSFFSNNHNFSKKVNLQSRLGFQSQSIGDIQLYQRANKPFDHMTQRNNSYSENKIYLRSLLSYNPTQKLKIAIGGEYNYWFYGTEWGKTKSSFLMDFAPMVKFAVLDSNSDFYSQYNQNGIVTLVDETINSSQISTFYEFNYLPFKNTTLLFSGRIDKHNMAKVAFSPRIAFIQKVNQSNYLKLIAQQSVRLPNFRELYALNYEQENYPHPEKLSSIELIYSSIIRDKFSTNLSIFYQNLNKIGWSDNNRSELIGVLNSTGFEFDIAYRTTKFNLALNYTFIKQLDWIPEFEHNAFLSNIGTDSLDISLTGSGNNRINNFPKHQFKLFTSYKINKAIYLHFNSRFATEYGQIEMLDMYQTIHDNHGNTETQEEMNNIYDDLLEKGYAMPSFTSNASASYNFKLGKTNLRLSIWVMNLVSVNHVRYVYQHWEEGNNRQYPRQIGFINEPRMYGISLKAKL